MADIGFYHPLIVHFAIALAITGVLFRWSSFAIPANAAAVKTLAGSAATLLLLGTAAAVVAARSGSDASIPVESLPGSAVLLREHAVWGVRTRNILLAVSAFELLAIAGRRTWKRPALLASGVIGLAALACIYETGERGGELVYAHAAGVGIRSGDPADVGRLLLAGLYQQAEVEERAGRSVEADALIELAARRFPAEPAAEVLFAETLLEHRHDPTRALALLRSVTVAPDDRHLRFRHGWLTADALEALGETEAARLTLQELQREFPEIVRIRTRLAATTQSKSS
ncbi:MAG TPA: hypothetical protein VLN59_00565 [Burkholderiales bacterium]|nr:hypothetical protein [Burkholderiales bacterium]